MYCDTIITLTYNFIIYKYLTRNRNHVKYNINSCLKKNLKSKISYIFKVTLYDNLYIDHKL
jgi:hypothetical protein